jgi:hydroxymethylbilane synthase
LTLHEVRMKPGTTIRLVTRGSRLALWQASRAADRVRTAAPDATVEVVTVVTTADRKPDRPLHEFGDKGLFVKEIEEALLAGGADAGVHSLKDLPGTLPDALRLGCVLEREDPRDALFSRSGAKLADLPPDPVIATSSLRRQGQVRALRPDARVVAVRGNVETRLRKLDEGQFDAIVMALAGVKRLGLAAGAAEVFDFHVFVPAAAQGAIGLEVPKSTSFGHIWQKIETVQARHEVDAEREFTRAIGADCKSPVACHCVADAGIARVVALACSVDGATVLRFDESCPESGMLALARAAAADLLKRGARELFA